MLYIIDPSSYEAHRDDLDEMYRLRYKVFYEQLGWDVSTQDDMEKDEYDEKHAYYLIYKDEKGKIRGTMRLIEMANPCMFDGPFSSLLPNLSDYKKGGYWEASRLAVDHNREEDYLPSNARYVCKRLLAGMILFGLSFPKPACFLSLAFSSVVRLYETYGLKGKNVQYDLSSKENLVVTTYFATQDIYRKISESSQKDYSAACKDEMIFSTQLFSQREKNLQMNFLLSYGSFAHTEIEHGQLN